MTCRESALSMLERGRVPLPLHHPVDGACSCGDPKCGVSIGKHPTIMDWANCCPTRDEVERWYDKDPDANVGMLCGKVSGIVVLDIDTRSGGIDSFNRLKNVPKTRIVKTGGGGWHYYFAYPNGGATVRSRSKIPGYPGLEVKSDGTQVVAPPSLHASGTRYAFDNNLPLAPWPMDLVPGEEKPPLVVPATAPEGTRHATLLSIAGALRRPGMSPGVILAALRAYNLESCVPLHDDEDVQRIARDIGAKPPDEKAAASLAQNGEEPSAPDDLAYANAAILASDLYDMDIPEPESLLGDGLLIRGTIGLLYGKPGLGKSFLLLQLALALAQGTPWLGISTKPTPTGVFCLEIMRFHLRKRLHAISGGSRHGHDRLPLLARDDMPVRMNLADPACMTLIERFIEKYELGAVIIDPLSRAQPGDVSKDIDMGPVMDNLDALTAKTKCACVIGHHDRKSQGGQNQDDEMDAAKGSGRLLQDPNLAIHVLKKEKLVRLTVTKTNFGVSPDPIWLSRSDTGLLLVTDSPDSKTKHAEKRRAEIKTILLNNAPTPLRLAEIAEIGQFLTVDEKPVSSDVIYNDIKALMAKDGLLATGGNRDRRYFYSEDRRIDVGTNTQVIAKTVDTGNLGI